MISEIICDRLTLMLISFLGRIITNTGLLSPETYVGLRYVFKLLRIE